MRVKKSLGTQICPECGFLQEGVSKDVVLVKCWRYTFDAVLKADAHEQAKSSEYDWAEIIRRIRRETKWKQEALALRLGINPTLLTDVKKGRKAMPEKALDFIKENYSKHLILKESKKI